MTHSKLRRWLWISLLALGVALFGAGEATSQSLPNRPRESSKSFVWHVRGNPGGGAVFLAGSLHELRARDRPSSSFFDAFAYSDRVVFEVDLAELDQLEFRRDVTRLARLPAGEKLSQRLDRETVERLCELARRNRLPDDEFERFRPWFASNYAALLMLSGAGFEGAHGTDRLLFERAVRERKPLEFLETGRQQLEILKSLPEDEVLASLKWDLTGGVAKAERLVEAWKSGNVEAMSRLIAFDQIVSPRSIERLLTKRNAAWLPRVEQWLAQTNCTMVVVGAAHLVGTNGLVHLLEQRGYSVLQMP